MSWLTEHINGSAQLVGLWLLAVVAVVWMAGREGRHG